MKAAAAAALLMMLSLLGESGTSESLARAESNGPSISERSLGITSFGDSITCGHNTTSYPGQTRNYAYLLSLDLGGPFTNRCHSGSQAADMARLQVYRRTNPQDSGSPTFTVMIGANDVEAYGPEVNRQWIFQRTLAASLAWLALPRAAKIFGQDTGVRLTGEWTADNALQAGVALQSRTLDSTAGVTLTTDGAIYVAYRIIDGNGGAASVTIDGENVGTLEARGVGGAKIRTWHGVEDTVALARYAVSPGRHSIVLTVCKGEPTKDTFSLVWIGAAAVRSGAVMPRVLTAGVLRQKGDTKKELTAQYDGFVRNIVGTLAADGLRVRFVSVRDYVNASTDMSDRLHPNDRGHQGLRSAFLSQVREERRE